MFESIRILRPQYVIAENVGAITFRGLDRVLSNLAEIGYDAEWQDIRAEDMGAPHRRERIFIIAYPRRELADSKCERRSKAKVFDSKSFKHKGFPREYSSAINKEIFKISEADFCREVNGFPDWVDRLRVLGNSIVPQIAEVLFKRIKKETP